MDDRATRFYYKSTLTMDKATYYEFSQMLYKQPVALTITIWSIYLLTCILQVVLPGDRHINIILPVFVAAYYVIRHIITVIAMKKGYERLTAANGNTPATYVTEFTNVIKEFGSGSEPVTYDFKDVMYITESTNMYVLLLKNHISVPAQKKPSNIQYDGEFLEYLFAKAYKVKDFGCANINAYRTGHLIAMIAAIVCLVAVIVVNYFIL